MVAETGVAYDLQDLRYCLKADPASDLITDASIVIRSPPRQVLNI